MIHHQKNYPSSPQKKKHGYCSFILFRRVLKWDLQKFTLLLFLLIRGELSERISPADSDSRVATSSSAPLCTLVFRCMVSTTQVPAKRFPRMASWSWNEWMKETVFKHCVLYWRLLMFGKTDVKRLGFIILLVNPNCSVWVGQGKGMILVVGIFLEENLRKGTVRLSLMHKWTWRRWWTGFYQSSTTVMGPFT